MIECSELSRKILQGPTIEGVTFLGGEPFAQAAALAEIGRELKENRLSVVTFTGYYIEQIRQANRSYFEELLAVTDLLIDGPFKRELLDTSRPWIGSANQRYHFLTDRYKHLESKLHNINNRLEIRIHTDGRIGINGLATKESIKFLLSNN